ncbi:MAG: formyl transferase [Sphingomicrobium sp.]
MPRRCDHWRIGVVEAPIEAIARAGSLEPFAIDWLDEPGDFRFRADPFGIVRDGLVHLFAEAYDYRDRHGRIVHFTIDPDGRSSPPRVALAEPWHLSYPQLIEDGDETWLLPEASKNGGLTLYRARDFPLGWERAATIALDVVPIDATPFRHDGRWWLAYASGVDREGAMSRLHLAFAEQLAGPWTPHPLNPVRIDRAAARPGGTPFRLDGRLVLPLQDNVGTYGAAIRLLEVTTLTPDAFAAAPGARIAAPSSAGRYREGLHTLSACGELTLIDVKRVDRSGRGWLIDLRRLLSRRVFS